MSLWNWINANDETVPSWFEDKWTWFNGGYAYHNGIEWQWLVLTKEI